jgi:hypothetical protein
MSKQNKLVSLPENLEFPGKVKSSDFKVETPKQGLAEGANQLVKAPTSPTLARGGDFKVGRSTSEEGTSVKNPNGVDFKSGDVTPNVEEDCTN